MGNALYAGFWRRFAAYVVDALVLLIPNIGIAMVLDGLAATLGQVLVFWIYKAGLESGARQATLGKRALGIKVTDRAGERISFPRATGRYLALFISAFLLGLGFLLAAFTARKQALHDLIASTLVVRAQATPEEVREGGGTMPLTAGVWIAAIFLGGLPVLGILAAIAIPAQQDYAVRARLSEAIFEAGQLKAEAAKEIAAFRGDPSTGATREVPPAGTYVKRLVVDRQAGTIDVRVDAAKLRAGGAIEEPAGVRLALAADGSTWTCAGYGIPNKYLPASCRR